MIIYTNGIWQVMRKISGKFFGLESINAIFLRNWQEMQVCDKSFIGLVLNTTIYIFIEKI